MTAFRVSVRSRESGDGEWPGACLAALPFVAALGWLYLPVVRDMAVQWYRNPNFSHGFLIPLVSGYLLWTRRAALRSAELRPWGWGSIPLIAGLLMFLGGTLGAAHTTLRLSLIAVAGGTVLFMCGREIFGLVLLPLIYLLFMIPLPAYLYDAVAFPLKIFVAWLSVAAMHALDMTVFREGALIVFPNVVLEIADACSGIRSLYTLLAFSVAFSILFLEKKWQKGVLVASVIPIAVAANTLRIVATGILARRYGAGVADGLLHDTAGLGVFSLSVAIVILIGVVLRRRGSEPRSR